ncbi:DUF4439 domain-containing protein [Isoptericola jiangsuensis]|uniref:DUF4439 domain-containing protein n=1 Tax=Isoptericola jiangsuensis TaxID=548579 RepID=UPI003AAE0F23
MDPHAASDAPRRRRRAVALAVLAAVLLGGCGLRLETPPPAEPDPDAVEIVRRTAVADALFVAEQADGAVSTLAGKRPRLTAELERIAEDSRDQAEQLGGTYDSGLEPEAPASSPGPSDDPVSTEDVVTALVDASGRSRTAAGTTDDGPLARLLASVGAAQTVSAVRVGAYGDTVPISVDPVVPAPEETPVVTDEPDTQDPSPVEATPTSRLAERAAATVVEQDDEDAEETEEGEQDADVVSSTVPDPDEPAVVPRGLTVADLRTLVESEDSAAYALDLRAALRDDDARARLAERAQAHDERSRAWALVAGVGGTEQDPRQVAYAVPRGSDDDELVRAVEDDLATGYATLVATTAVGTRAVLVDLLVESALTLDAWGADPVPFPGLPEQAPQ